MSVSPPLRAGIAGSDSWRTITRNDYDGDGNLATAAGATYALGSIIWQHGETYKNDVTGDIDDSMTRFDYQWFEGAVQSGVAYDKHYGWSNNGGPVFNLANFNTNFTTGYTINGIGQTTGAAVRDGVAKDVAYTLDGLGQIIKRDETRVNASGTPLPAEAAPHELFNRFAGKQMGMVGNNGTLDTGYAQSVKERSTGRPDITSASAGLFRNGTNSGSASYADFSQSLEAYNSNAQGSGPSTGSGSAGYVVRTGDTL